MNNNKGNKGSNKRNNRGRRNFNNKKGEEKSFPKTNHFPWYTKNPDVLKAASNIPFTRIPGIPVRYADNILERVEAAMSLNVQPCFVLNDDTRSYLNDIANDQYAYVRHANSGHSNYEATDLLIAQLAMTQPYSFYSWMCRVYGLLNYYTPNNRCVPDVFGEALHVDIPKLQRDKAQFYSYISIFAKRLQQFYVPKLDVYSKMTYMYANIYADRTDERAQLYIPTTNVWMIYSPRTSSTGGELVTKVYMNSNTSLDIDGIRAIGDELLDALVVDEDIGIISGDVLKAYGAAGCIAPAVIPQEYTTRPIYDPVFLNLVENARIFPNFSATNTTVGKISQLISADGSSLKAEWSTSRNKTGSNTRDLAIVSFANSKIPLNCHSIVPTDEEITEATRFIYSAKLDDTGSKYTYTITSSDLFLVNNFIVYTRTATGSYVHTTYSDPFLINDEDQAQFLNDTCAFTVKPRMLATVWDEDADDFVNSSYIMEWDNYTPLSDQEIIGLNRACMLSEFDFPHRGG